MCGYTSRTAWLRMWGPGRVAVQSVFERPENASRGAIQLDGGMVERLHADMAKRTIAIADAIAAMGE